MLIEHTAENEYSRFYIEI